MARRLDVGKLLEWKRRLATFRSSGQSVAAYCRQQKICPNRFYYWKRRVGEADTAGLDGKPPQQKMPAATEAAWVEVIVGDSMCVRLPQDPQLIGAVVRQLQLGMRTKPAFERIDLVPGR